MGEMARAERGSERRRLESGSIVANSGVFVVVGAQTQYRNMPVITDIVRNAMESHTTT
jgi:hypothetical protein